MIHQNAHFWLLALLILNQTTRITWHLISLYRIAVFNSGGIDAEHSCDRNFDIARHNPKPYGIGQCDRLKAENFQSTAKKDPQPHRAKDRKLRPFSALWWPIHRRTQRLRSPVDPPSLTAHARRDADAGRLSHVFAHAFILIGKLSTLSS